MKYTRIVWGPDHSHFVVSYPHRICVWKFEKEANSITLSKAVTVNQFEVRNVALANHYIVASDAENRIHIWNRNTGEKMKYRQPEGWDLPFLYDSAEEDGPIDDIYPVSLSCHGKILVSTSRVACAICVWNMKTGELLKKHNDAEDERYDGHFDEKFIPDMAYLKQLNAFVCTGEYMRVWSFPTNEQQFRAASSKRWAEESYLQLVIDTEEAESH